MALDGKTILITRPREQSTKFIEEIERRGGKTVVFPTIRILPPASWAETDNAIRGLSTYNGFLFTSANAVRWFFERCTTHGIGASAFAEGVFAVGEKTGEALHDHGVIVRALPEDHRARGMLESMAKEELSNRRFLFPRGDLAQDELVTGLLERGAVVDSIMVYRTAPPDEHAAAQLRTRAARHQIDVVTFFSPSAVRNFVRLCEREMLHQLLDSARFAAIGPTTGDAMIDAGLRVDIRGQKPNAESLAQAIDDSFEGASP
jgi:uroporphyrinogen III methyltransferase / synthase